MSYSDQGGAAKSCIRLHLGLLKLGVTSRLLVLVRNNSEIPESYQFYPKYVIKNPPALKNRIRTKIHRILKELGLNVLKPKKETSHEEQLKGRPVGYEKFSNPKTEWDITQDENYHWADIINLHWVSGLLDYESFFNTNTKPVVWTLHDMNPFSGGCHYSLGCQGYTQSCENCPQLAGALDTDYSAELLQVKEISLKNAISKPVIVSPSNWLKTRSEGSHLFRHFKHFTIPYGLNTEIFSARDKRLSREILNIPQDKYVVLFVAESIDNRRKGFDKIIPVVQANQETNILFCSVGKGSPDLMLESHLHLGPIYDERLMSMVYSAADLFIVASAEDNFPNTVLEAMSCGCPVLGFNNGGIPEMFDENCGFIINDPIHLESSIKQTMLSAQFNNDLISCYVQSKYHLTIQAKEYVKIYKSILAKRDEEALAKIH